MVMSELTYTEEERQKAIQSILKRQEYQRQYYHEHRAERAERDRQYSQEHEAEIAERHRKYYQEHKEEWTVYDRRRKQEHAEEIAEYQHQYYQEHREEILEGHHQYFREHREKFYAAGHKRRALMAGSNGDFTTEEFRLLCEAYENRCAYCHEYLPLTPDHAVPLSRGGNNNIENIVPSCLPCNLKKHTMTCDEYLEVISR